MKKITTYFLTSILLFTGTMALGQSPLEIQIDWEKKQTLINGSMINKTTSLTRLRSILGKENRELSEAGNPTRLYIYDSLGINFIVDTTLGVLNKMDIYCVPGKQNFETSPAKPFNGNLEINKQSIHFQDSIGHLRSITGIPFEELSPGFYWYIAIKSEFAICVAYLNKLRKQMSMVYVLFNRDENSHQ